MKKAFDGFVSRLEVLEERVSELKHVSIEPYKTENLREQNLKENNIQPWDNSKRHNTFTMGKKK